MTPEGPRREAPGAFRDRTVSWPVQLTVRVNVCVAVPMEFVAVMVRT